MTAPTTTRPVAVLVADDQMQATVRPAPSAPPGALTIESVAAAVAQAGVAITEDAKRRIEEFVKLIRAAPFDGKDFVIAQGSMPDDGRDGTVEWTVQGSNSSPSLDTRFDQQLRSAFIFAATTGPIGKVVPPCPPSDGRDITGTAIPSSNVPRPVELGQNVTLAADGVTAVAAAPGKVVFQDCKLSIEEARIIAGDLRNSSGNIDVESHVVVTGSISNGTAVRTSQSLLVQGTIEEATIEIGGDLVVHGGVVTGESGKVTAQGIIAARFCDSARLDAGGDIVLVRECINAQVETRRRLLVENGAIVGGDVRAQRGVVVTSLGCDAGTPTNVSIGSKVRLLKEQQNIDRLNAKRRDALTNIRKNVGPLMACLKRLSAQQREQATELMFQADSLEAEIKESEEKIHHEIKTYQDMIAASLTQDDAGPSVVVLGCIFPGARVTFDDLTTMCEKCINGPVRIQAKVLKGVRTLVAIETGTGRVTELKTDHIKLDSLEAAESARTQKPAETKPGR